MASSIVSENAPVRQLSSRRMAHGSQAAASDVMASPHDSSNLTPDFGLAPCDHQASKLAAHARQRRQRQCATGHGQHPSGHARPYRVGCAQCERQAPAAETARGCSGAAHVRDLLALALAHTLRSPTAVVWQESARNVSACASVENGRSTDPPVLSGPMSSSNVAPDAWMPASSCAEVGQPFASESCTISAPD